MGLKSLFNAAKDKAVQAVNGYKQMVAEVEEDAANWRGLNPVMLRAILDGDSSRARDIYKQDTGASTAKAVMFIEKAKDNVKKFYPDMLKAQSMDKIKDVWPFGRKSIMAFSPLSQEGKSKISYVRMDADINGNYSFYIDTLDVIDYPEKSCPVIIKDGKIYLKWPKDIQEIKDFKVGEYNFNPNDEEYSNLKKAYELVTKNAKLADLHSKEDLDKVANGELSEEALGVAGTKYSFSFVAEDGPYCDILKSEGLNIATRFKTAFFDLYLHLYANQLSEDNIHPWEMRIFYDVLGRSAGFLGYNIRTALELLTEEFNSRNLVGDPDDNNMKENFLKYVEMGKKEEYSDLERNALPLIPSMGKCGLYLDQDNNLQSNQIWNENVQTAEGIYKVFQTYIDSSSLPVRPQYIEIRSHIIMLHYGVDLINNLYLNEKAKTSLKPLVEMSTIIQAISGDFESFTFFFGKDEGDNGIFTKGRSCEGN